MEIDSEEKAKHIKDIVIKIMLITVIIVGVGYLVVTEAVFDSTFETGKIYNLASNLELTSSMVNQEELNKLKNEAVETNSTKNEETKTENTKEEDKKEENTEGETDEKKTTQKKKTTDEIPAKMNGYKVLGQLIINKIGVKKNILSVPSKGALNTSVVKQYGPDINEIGNLCIAGHNWSSMLGNLKKLEKGDIIYLVNRKTKSKVTYKVYDIRVRETSDTACLNQNNNGKREVTIYTCTPNGRKRVVCRAREI